MALNLFELKSIEEFKSLSQQELDLHVVTADEVRHLFELCDALWLHSADPAAPHAELTSGKCSNGFIDALRALRFSYLGHFLAKQLVYSFRSKFPELTIDWVIGSDHAAASFSHSVALVLQAQHDFTEKGENKAQVWKRFEIKSEERVLQAEELITTTNTVQAVRDGIRAGNQHLVTFAPVVLTLIHRSPIYEFEGSPILYLAHYDIDVWEPSKCPLCAQGSKRLRPKQNWNELTLR